MRACVFLQARRAERARIVEAGIRNRASKHEAFFGLARGSGGELRERAGSVERAGREN